MLYSSLYIVSVRAHEPSFTWSGVNKRSLALSPLDRRSVQLYASFTEPGVYCLNSLRIKAATRSSGDSNGNNMAIQRWFVSSYIVIAADDDSWC